MRHSFLERSIGGALVLAWWLVSLADPVLSQESADKDAQSTPAAKSAAVAAQEKPADTAEYFELLKLFADTLDQVERNYVKDISRRELMEAAIRGMLTKLDPYSNYIDPENMDDFRTNVENEFGGIGIRLHQQEDGKLTVVSPLANTPAYRAGLQAGDVIVEIEGKSTEGLSIEDAIMRLKGEVGSKVTIRVQHAASEDTREVTLKRENVQLETVMGHHRDADDQWDYFLDEKDKIGYIRVSAFSRQTADDIRDALDQLRRAGMRALVLDLRFNPGGLLSSAVEVSDLFVTEGTIVSTSGRNTVERSWKAHSRDTFTGFPMIVLVNRYSASASEIVAACLQDHHRAIIVGERTWGKGSVQNVIPLEDGNSALKLTTASYQRPSGKNIHRFPGAKETEEWGVRPDDGFLVEFSNSQLRQLSEYRQKVEVIRNLPDDEESLELPDFDDTQLTRGLEQLRRQLEGSAVAEKASPNEEQAETEPVVAHAATAEDSGKDPEGNAHPAAPSSQQPQK